MVKVTAAAALSTLLLSAAPANAKTFRGTTNHSRTATLVTGADGVPPQVRVLWRAPCKQPRYRATGGTRFQTPFTSVSADVVTATDKTYRVRLPPGPRGRGTTNPDVQRPRGPL